MFLRHKRAGIDLVRFRNGPEMCYLARLLLSSLQNSTKPTSRNLKMCRLFTPESAFDLTSSGKVVVQIIHILLLVLVFRRGPVSLKFTSKEGLRDAWRMGLLHLNWKGIVFFKLRMTTMLILERMTSVPEWLAIRWQLCKKLGRSRAESRANKLWRFLPHRFAKYEKIKFLVPYLTWL